MLSWLEVSKTSRSNWCPAVDQHAASLAPDNLALPIECFDSSHETPLPSSPVLSALRNYCQYRSWDLRATRQIRTTLRPVYTPGPVCTPQPLIQVMVEEIADIVLLPLGLYRASPPVSPSSQLPSTYRRSKQFYLVLKMMLVSVVIDDKGIPQHKFQKGVCFEFIEGTCNSKG